MSHTPEPWKKGTTHPYVDYPESITALDVPEADYDRALLCVNGCAGLNPASYRACIKLLHKWVNTYGTDRTYVEKDELARETVHALTLAEQP